MSDSKHTLREVDAAWLIQRIDRWLDGHACGRQSTIELLVQCRKVLAMSEASALSPATQKKTHGHH